MKRTSFTTALGLGLALTCMLTPIQAASFAVADGDVAGLIAAVQSANTNADPSNTINLAVGGTYTLTAASESGGYHGSTGLPVIIKPLVINGNGATIQRSSAPGIPGFRILRVEVGYIVPGVVNLTLDHVTIRGGLGAGNIGTGGGLLMTGNTVLIRNSTITDNYGYEGGGVANYAGYLIIENSTISYNTGFGGRTGGGIYSESFGGPGPVTTVISNSTIFENRADGFPGFQGRGDALAGGGFIVKNSVIASPTRGLGRDCVLVIADSRGYNIASDNSCGLSGAGDRNNTDPLLGPLANNGGLTPTHLPLAGSPVIDAVPVANCTDVGGTPVPRDQRDVLRPQGAACDIGSVDVASDVSAPVITPSITGTMGAAGWYRSGVSVSWSVTDPESGIASSSGCGISSLTADTVGVSLTCSAVNGVGISGSNSVTIKIDQTAPEIGATRTPAANANGWNNTNVTVNFACSDAMSGVGSLTPVSALFSAEGANQSVAGLCTDVAGNSAGTVLGGINIDKAAPVTANVTASPNPVAVQTAVTLSASLSDSGGSGLGVAEYSVNGSVPALLSAASGAAASVGGALPPFAATGVYSLCVRARDLAGNVGAEDCMFLPVYDPTGGFVTGGGWINSPAGAYAADPSLSGKATFGFESRYKNGANMPTGNTQFQFRAGDLNFKSTSYDWLVIAGARAQYKGTGTINGTGSYNFILTAIDGESPGGGGADRFRIKIWSSGVIYDNQSGAGDSENPTTSLGGGSIVIHTN